MLQLPGGAQSVATSTGDTSNAGDASSDSGLDGSMPPDRSSLDAGMDAGMDAAVSCKPPGFWAARLVRTFVRRCRRSA